VGGYSRHKLDSTSDSPGIHGFQSSKLFCYHKRCVIWRMTPPLPPEFFWSPPRCVRSVSASLSKPVPERSDVPPPSSACNPIAQRAAPIPPTAQWRCSPAHLPARALDPIPRSVRIYKSLGCWTRPPPRMPLLLPSAAESLVKLN